MPLSLHLLTPVVFVSLPAVPAHTLPREEDRGVPAAYRGSGERVQALHC